MYNYLDLDMENARELLKIVESQNGKLLTIMHQYTNYVILILAGIWAFFANSFHGSTLNNSSNLTLNFTSYHEISNFILTYNLSDPSMILLITIWITITILIVWRLYVHSLDNEIAKNYKKIIKFEKRIYGNTNEVPESSTLYSLVENIPHLKKLLIEKNKKCYDQQAEAIFNLIDQKLIGSREQQIFDILS